MLRWYDPAAVSVVFFTGYPGFLGSELLPRILRRRADAVAHCLVQPKFAALARERAAQYGERVRIIEGDITTRIGVADDDVVEIWHLAAVYDLSVPESIGVAVNVDGTKHVLDFAERCASLERLHYVSTCYVSGRYEGRFREDDLEVNQSFNNFYESTKYLAEVEVRKRRGLPVTIYRPSVVVGDSATGATQKFDGPYFVMQWILRQPQNFSLLPVVGRPADYRFNVVPRDFIVEAIDYLSAHPASLGRCYQLADPAPLTVDETIEAIAAATGHRVVRVPLPASVAKGAIEHVPGVYRMMRIPSAAVNYFVHPTDYDTTNATRDLDGSGISVPRFADYARNLVAFVRAHPEVGAKGMA
ncbi:MAG TPA: SDR family oxidoreductase [Thermoanaerobaculia bacterium]